jgi:hypothetical protein
MGGDWWSGEMSSPRHENRTVVIQLVDINYYNFIWDHQSLVVPHVAPWLMSCHLLLVQHEISICDTFFFGTRILLFISNKLYTDCDHEWLMRYLNFALFTRIPG